MNKFDDMMRYLHNLDERFAQVVAVDKNFDLFWRAWCQAELVEAAVSELRQVIKIHSAKAFDDNCDKLENLKIEHCEASRPQDKEFILSKIEDKAAFNAQLQT